MKRSNETIQLLWKRVNILLPSTAAEARRIDDALRYGELFESAGGVIQIHAWEGIIHVFPSNVAELKAAPEALDQIGGFLGAQAFASHRRKD